MISQEARDLFAANVKAMTAGDAAHLASQLLPDDVSRLKDIAYVHDGDAAHLLDIYTRGCGGRRGSARHRGLPRRRPVLRQQGEQRMP